MYIVSTAKTDIVKCYFTKWNNCNISWSDSNTFHVL